MRGMYPDLPLVGIEPAVKPAAQNHRGEKVAVMATPLTLHEEKFKQLVKRYENLATIDSKFRVRIWWNMWRKEF